MRPSKYSKIAFDHWNAKNYSENSNLQYGLATSALNHCDLKKNDAVLDIGCGDGRITTLIAEKVSTGHVTGIDASAAMIEHAKHFEKKYKNLSFQQQEATQLDVDSAFDWVTSFSCLHWIENQRVVWEGIHKALKTNGKAVVLFYKRHPYLWDSINNMMTKPEWEAYFKDFHTALHTPEYECSKEEYAKILKDCGFNIVSMEEETRIYCFENRQELEDFIAAWLPHLAKIPPEKQNAFMQELCDDYFQIIPLESSGQAKMPFTHRLFVVSK
jgi:trans-aconitate methyltransferase